MLLHNCINNKWYVEIFFDNKQSSKHVKSTAHQATHFCSNITSSITNQDPSMCNLVCCDLLLQQQNQAQQKFSHKFWKIFRWDFRKTIMLVFTLFISYCLSASIKYIERCSIPYKIERKRRTRVKNTYTDVCIVKCILKQCNKVKLITGYCVLHNFDTLYCAHENNSLISFRLWTPHTRLQRYLSYTLPCAVHKWI